MTTYYLRSQITEKLGTDTELANQIPLLPQTSHSVTGSNYIQKAYTYPGTAADPTARVNVFPLPGARYDYVSVKNTGANPLIISANQKIVSVDEVVSAATTTTYGVPITEITFSGTAAFLNTLIFYGETLNVLIEPEDGNVNAQIIKVDNSANKIIVKGDVTGDINASPATTAFEFAIGVVSLVPAGSTFVSYADGNLQNANTAFVLAPQVNDAANAFLPYSATVFAMESSS